MGGGISLRVAALTLLFGVGMLPPFVFLLWSSLHHFQPNGAFGDFTLDHFAAILADPRLGRLFLNSAVYSLGAALLALVVGGAQAWLAERTDMPLRSLLYLASIVSLGIPFVLYIVAWLLFLGKSGPLNAWLLSFVGGEGPALNVNSIGGMIFVEGMLWSPLAFLMLASVFRNSDASFEEAAIMSGASLPTMLRRVTLGMAGPALLALMILVFIRAAESFEAPALVGLPGGARVLTTTIFERLTLDMPPDTGSAAAFGVILLVVMAGLLAIYNRVTAHSHRYRAITGKGFRPRVTSLGRWRWVVGPLVALMPILVVAIPFTTILWAALLPYYQPFSLEALPRLGFGNFAMALASQSFRESILNSLLLGACAATFVTAIAAIAGWCVARHVPGARIVDNLAALPLVFPSIVLGLAFLEILTHWGAGLYGSVTSLVLVSSIAFMPYGMRYAQLGVMQIHPELEEAASIAGAGAMRGFFRVVLPLLAPALISCWLFVFLLAVRAMSMVLLLVGPKSQVIATVLFDLWNNGQIGELAALGTLWTAIMTLFSVAFFLATRRFQLAME